MHMYVHQEQFMIILNCFKLLQTAPDLCQILIILNPSKVQQPIFQARNVILLILNNNLMFFTVAKLEIFSILSQS